MKKPKKIKHPEDLVKLASQLIQDHKKEHLIGVYLDSRFVPIKVELISLGTVDKAIVHPREILKPAILSSASSFVILHNHPFNHVKPTKDDKEIIKELKKAGLLIGIYLADGIIFNKNNDFFSFEEEGLM